MLHTDVIRHMYYLELNPGIFLDHKNVESVQLLVI